MTSLQLNILLLLLGAIQGAILFLLLYKKRESLPGYAFLAGYLCVMIFQIMMKVMSKMWLWQSMKPVYFFSYQLPLIYGPLVWLFIKHFTRRSSNGKKDILHLLLAVVLGTFFTFLSLRLGPALPGEWLISGPRKIALQIISLSVYHYLAFRMLRDYWAGLPIQLIAFYKDGLNWVRQFIISSFIICSAISVIIYLMYIHFPHWYNARWGFVMLTVFIYWISYRSWVQPELFNAISHYRVGGNVLVPVFNASVPQKKYTNSGLSEDEMRQIITSLEDKLRSEKSYLDPELTIDHLATLISCKRHHLSQAMNEVLGKSFYDYINHFRVEEAKLLLINPSKNKYKITFLAYDAGFNSISTFNDVFKKATGITPSQFRKEQQGMSFQKQSV